MKKINKKTTGFKLKPAHKKSLNKALETLGGFSPESIIEMWNAITPHFCGSGPHRYDYLYDDYEIGYNDKECAYCFRPKSWKKIGRAHV